MQKFKTHKIRENVAVRYCLAIINFDLTRNMNFFTSSSSPSALTTVSVFRFVFSSKCGGEYPGNALLVWLLSSFVKGFTSTSGDSSSPLRSTIVLWSKSRSWDDTSLDRWTLSSTERRVMEDLKMGQKLTTYFSHPLKLRKQM